MIDENLTIDPKQYLHCMDERTCTSGCVVESLLIDIKEIVINASSVLMVAAWKTCTFSLKADGNAREIQATTTASMYTAAA